MKKWTSNTRRWRNYIQLKCCESPTKWHMLTSHKTQIPSPFALLCPVNSVFYISYLIWKYFLCFRLQSNRYNAERYFERGRLWRCRGGVHVGNDFSSVWVACSRQPQGRFQSYECDAIWSDGYIITFDSQNAENRFLLNSETCALHSAMSCPIQPYTKCYSLSEPSLQYRVRWAPFAIFSFQDNTYAEVRVLCAWLYDNPSFFR